MKNPKEEHIALCFERFNDYLKANMPDLEPSPLQPHWRFSWGWAPAWAWEHACGQYFLADCKDAPGWMPVAYLLHENGLDLHAIARIHDRFGERGLTDAARTMCEHGMFDRAYYMEDGKTRLIAPPGTKPPLDFMGGLPSGTADAVVLDDDIQGGRRRLTVRVLFAGGRVDVLEYEGDAG